MLSAHKYFPNAGSLSGSHSIRFTQTLAEKQNVFDEKINDHKI